jgi:hypothetical protein
VPQAYEFSIYLTSEASFMFIPQTHEEEVKVILLPQSATTESEVYFDYLKNITFSLR